MVRYAITGGMQNGAGDALLEYARRWAAEGVEYVQLREQQMEAGEQVRVAKAMLAIFQQAGGRTKLLVNHRVDVALAAECGVHLTSQRGELKATQVRRLLGASAAVDGPRISMSCHSLDDVRRAVSHGVDLILFGPVFEKRIAGKLVVAGIGLERLQEACALCAIAGTAQVLALGGVTQANAALCVKAGAAGIAGIRTFA